MDHSNQLLSKIQNVSRSIGAILIDSGKLTSSDAEKILTLQRETGLKFGEAAIQLGLLQDHDILHALSLQFNHPYLQTSSKPTLSPSLVAAYRPFSKEGEQIRALRSQLQIRWFDEAKQQAALCVVSPNQRDGRSQLAANLAIAFAQAGERTLLIDGDMRTPSQHMLFGLTNDNGLSRLLAGRLDDRVVNFVSGLPGLGVLTAGPPPPNAMELLGRHGFETVLHQSRASFDVVIVDTPACELGPDAQLLSRFCGAALAVSRSNLTRVDDFTQMVEDLTSAGTRVVGSVLVDAPTKAQASWLPQLIRRVNR